MISIKQISQLTPREYLELQESFKEHLKESRNIKYWKDKTKSDKLKEKLRKQPNLL